jgi:hypothetical protein
MHSTPRRAPFGWHSALRPLPVVRWALFLTAAATFFAAVLPPAPASAAGVRSFDWLFDRSYYTDNPRTGHRIWQYAPDPTPFRDPFAVYDSSHSSYPFEPQGYDPYPYYYNQYYSPMMYPSAPWGSGWFYGWNVNGYYPIDGGQPD